MWMKGVGLFGFKSRRTKPLSWAILRLVLLDPPYDSEPWRSEQHWATGYGSVGGQEEAKDRNVLSCLPVPLIISLDTSDWVGKIIDIIGWFNLQVQPCLSRCFLLGDVLSNSLIPQRHLRSSVHECILWHRFEFVCWICCCQIWYPLVI